MERRNIIIVGVAVLLGIAAVLIANAWFSGVEQQQERVAEKQALTKIAVARLDLPFGTPLTADNVRLVDWPAQSVPAGSYSTADKLIAGGNVTIRPIAAGEPILLSRISERAVLSANLPVDMRAITVPVDAVSGVAGFVTPGDVVDVLLTRQIPGEGATASDKMTNVLLENVQVLAVDERKSETDTETKVGNTATLQVDQMGAQKLALALEVGKLSLTLRNVENTAMGPTSTVTLADLGGNGRYIRPRPGSGAAPASAPVRMAGYAPPAPVRATGVATALPRRSSGPTMTVFRGTESTTAEVQRYAR